MSRGEFTESQYFDVWLLYPKVRLIRKFRLRSVQQVDNFSSIYH